MVAAPKSLAGRISALLLFACPLFQVFAVGEQHVEIRHPTAAHHFQPHLPADRRETHQIDKVILIENFLPLEGQNHIVEFQFGQSGGRVGIDFDDVRAPEPADLEPAAVSGVNSESNFTPKYDRLTLP